MKLKTKTGYTAQVDGVRPLDLNVYTPRIGDIVTLNVGSPPMTVVDFDADTVTVGFRNEIGGSYEMTTTATALNAG